LGYQLEAVETWIQLLPSRDLERTARSMRHLPDRAAITGSAIGLYAVAQAIAVGQIGAINPFIQVGFSAVAGMRSRQALKTRRATFASLRWLSSSWAWLRSLRPFGIRLFFRG